MRGVRIVVVAGQAGRRRGQAVREANLLDLLLEVHPEIREQVAELLGLLLERVALLLPLFFRAQLDLLRDRMETNALSL